MKVTDSVEFEDYFKSIIKEVIENISKRAQELLKRHINADTYGIGRTETGKPSINEYYLNGTGTPSYEFRDKAWETEVNNELFKLFYNSDLLSAPSESSPYLHGNYRKNEDRRKELANYLNVKGVDTNNDFGGKKREPFWDNFVQELKQRLGKWLYTEFNKRGIKIPDLKNAKF